MRIIVYICARIHFELLNVPFPKRLNITKLTLLFLLLDIIAIFLPENLVDNENCRIFAGANI